MAASGVAVGRNMDFQLTRSRDESVREGDAGPRRARHKKTN